jgi:hypothetical protein
MNFPRLRGVARIDDQGDITTWLTNLAIILAISCAIGVAMHTIGLLE